MSNNFPSEDLQEPENGLEKIQALLKILPIIQEVSLPEGKNFDSEEIRTLELESVIDASIQSFDRLPLEVKLQVRKKVILLSEGGKNMVLCFEDEEYRKVVADFINNQKVGRAKIVSFHGITFIAVPSEIYKFIRLYWQDKTAS